MIEYQQGLQSIETSQKLPLPIVHYKASGESTFLELFLLAMVEKEE